MRTRLVGALLLALSGVAIFMLRSLAALPPSDHPASTAELLLGAVVVVAGLPGMGLLVEGSAIFERSRSPRRP